MNNYRRSSSLFWFAMVSLPGIDAFSVATSERLSTVLKANGTGGWGIGNSREMVPEEFARGDREAFQGYELQERGDFMRKVKDDLKSMRDSELEEMLGVASMAGIEIEDPNTRLNKFDAELFDDDDLDLSVTWEDDTTATGPSGQEDSITRMDEDTLGIW